MRAVVVTSSVVALLMLTGLVAQAAGPIAPKCSSADTQRRAILFSGAFKAGGGGYARHCGPGRAVVRVGGKSFTILGGRGGFCHRKSSPPQWVYFGLFANGSLPGARGLAFVVSPGNRPGRNKIIDSAIQLPGVSLAQTPTGTAIVAKGLKSATFSLTTGGPNPTRITGSWTCG